ncbi:histidine kinase N-terminal 7TM domain-containing protein [Tindallia californiensis]|nr:histidine kinase N-terminal 7TM domain-containing protein [Tindallia californiensis]
MNTVQLTYTLLLLSTILCSFFLLRYAYNRRKMPAAKYFMMLLIMAAFYSMAYVGEINAKDFSTAIFWFNVQHIPIPIQHYLWMLMSLEYSGASKKIVQLAKYAGLYHPIFYILIFFTNNYHQLYISSFQFESNGYFEVIVTTKGPLFMVLVASGTFLGIISMFFYIKGLLRASAYHKNGYVIMIIASLLPWMTVYLNASNRSYLGIDYFPIVSGLSGILYIFGIFYFRVFNTIPLATEIVYKQSNEGILLIDVNDHVIDVNDTLLQLYPDLRTRPQHYTFTSFLNHHPELRKIKDSHYLPQFTLPIKGGIGYYSAKVTSIFGESHLEIGKIVTITDITLFIENQKALESIATTALDKAETSELSFLQAQINPHFLNNTLSVIGAMINRDPVGARELIGNLGEYLTNRCYFDHTNPMVSLEEELEAVNTYVAIEKARFGNRLNFHVVCTNVPQVYIPRLILQPLVENAIQHGILKKADGGNVWLLINKRNDEVFFEVKDDGVGIGESQKILSGKNGKGVGIPNIHKRLLSHYKNGLTIENTEEQGTSITFSVPYSSKPKNPSAVK